jgi:hypothetical protein
LSDRWQKIHEEALGIARRPVGAEVWTRFAKPSSKAVMEPKVEDGVTR